MKSIFKAIALTLYVLNQSVYSRDIILIENRASIEEGQLLKSILLKKFHIPNELITLKNTKNNCETQAESVVHLCLENNGELIIKKLNQYIVKNSLGVFLNQTEKEGEKKI